MKPLLQVAGALGVALMLSGCRRDNQPQADAGTAPSNDVQTASPPLPATPAATDPSTAGTPATQTTTGSTTAQTPATTTTTLNPNDSGQYNKSRAKIATHVQVNDSGQISIKGTHPTTK
jgi:hypothetical protein